MSKKILSFILIVFGVGVVLMFFGSSPLIDGDLTEKTGPNELIAPENPEEKNKKEEVEEKEKPSADLPEIAIIIDDLGNSFSQDKRIAFIDADLTLAVLPFGESTQKSLSFFHGRQELILHLPLEPVSPDQKEENMIMANMTEDQISERLNLALADLNFRVSGVNNHKGSLFTSDRKSMKVLLEQIKQKKLFFVDSYTIASSMAYDLAKKMGIKTAKRDVFLDGSKKEEDIKTKLQEAVALAKERGSAVAIGHSRPETINVLTEEIPKLKDEIRFVKISEFLE